MHENEQSTIQSKTFDLLKAAGVNSSKAQHYSRLICELNAQGTVSNANLTEWVQKLARGLPFGHVTGHTKFCGQWAIVNERVLEPHPSTEVLVAICSDWLRSQPQAALRGAEIGTGSGVIMRALLLAYPSLNMIGSEICPHAIENTRSNLAEHAGVLKRASVLLAEASTCILSPFDEPRKVLGPFDFLISNPPYLHLNDDIDPSYKDHMPSRALYGPDETPSYHAFRIAEHARAYLKPGGRVFLEGRTARSAEVREAFTSQGFVVRQWQRNEVPDSILSHVAFEHWDRSFSNHVFLDAHMQ